MPIAYDRHPFAMRSNWMTKCESSSHNVPRHECARPSFHAAFEVGDVGKTDHVGDHCRGSAVAAYNDHRSVGKLLCEAIGIFEDGPVWNVEHIEWRLPLDLPALKLFVGSHVEDEGALFAIDEKRQLVGGHGGGHGVPSPSIVHANVRMYSAR